MASSPYLPPIITLTKALINSFKVVSMLTMKIDDLTFYSVYGVLQSGMWLLNDLEAYLKPHDMSQGRLAIMLAILQSSDGVINPKYIAEITGKSRPTITRMVEKLELDGLISSMPDVCDARSKCIRLTRRGELLLDKVIPEYNKRIHEMSAALDSKDKKQLLAILQRLNFPGTDKKLMIPDELR